MIDKARNNDTLVSASNEEIGTVTTQHRLRCSGHIINWVVKAIHYGEGITEFNKRVIGCSDSKAFELWRKFGALGKVHNTVKYIMSSDQRCQSFLGSQELAAAQDDDDDFLFQQTKSSSSTMAACSGIQPIICYAVLPSCRQRSTDSKHVHQGERQRRSLFCHSR